MTPYERPRYCVRILSLCSMVLHVLSRHRADSQKQLGLENGALFAVPIPQEYEAKGEAIQKLVEQAVAESVANGMSQRGKEVTPWLLARVAELTKGESLGSNLALLRNTAHIGGYS